MSLININTADSDQGLVRTIASHGYAIDKLGADERAASFTKRSIKSDSKLAAIRCCVSMIDLTTLEGADTPGKVKQLCAKARNPLPGHIENELSQYKNFQVIPQVAAICVYPSMVELARKELLGTDIKVASVATAFPSGQASLKTKLVDVKEAVDAGAQEIDMVINRGAFLSGEYQRVFDEIVAVKAACGEAHLKVILETGELGSYDQVRFASDLAIEAGADFIKTSTGKVTPAATMPVTYIMLQAISDHYERTGKKIGMKPAGGIRTTKEAIHYLCMVNETLGQGWLHADLFRFGASALLNDLLKQYYKQLTGRYTYDQAFSVE
ncbi:MAG: deoxyribose-phosphate aldolase [Oligoflexales bacterium]|nr:deoxyribose-phosphate aldolase [Oligoflexales bacterium]